MPCRVSECLQALRQLRRRSDVSREFNEAYRALTSDARLGDRWADILLHSPSIRLRASLALALQLAQPLAGIQIVAALGRGVLAELGVRGVLFGLFLSSAAGLVGAVLMLRLVDESGRRCLLLAGSAIMFVSWAAAAIAESWSGVLEGSGRAGYVPHICLGVSLCALSLGHSLGPGSVAWTIAGEVFPFRGRGKAQAAATATYFGVTLVAGGCFEEQLQLWGFSRAHLLALCAVLCLLLGLLVLVAVPETKGESPLRCECACPLPPSLTAAAPSPPCPLLPCPGVSLEEMEELFALDGSAPATDTAGTGSSAGGIVCCCCPAGSGTLMGRLGQRLLADPLPGHFVRHLSVPGGTVGGGYRTPGLKSGASSNYRSYATPGASGRGHVQLTDVRYTPGRGAHSRGGGDREAFAAAIEGEEEELEQFEPSSLHKYSTDLRETQFNYYQHDGGGTSDGMESLVPKFNLNV